MSRGTVDLKVPLEQVDLVIWAFEAYSRALSRARWSEEAATMQALAYKMREQQAKAKTDGG